MRKLFLFVVSFCFILAASSQISPNAIGLRGGSGIYGGGAEITYQKAMGGKNRLELDFGARSNSNRNHLLITGIYHWWWNITDGLNWYAGPGAQLGLYNERKNDNNDGITLGIGGQIGIEYNFNDLGAPILLSLDTRPMWDFFGYYNGFAYGGAFAIRYTF
jgi:hypothetical protein